MLGGIPCQQPSTYAVRQEIARKFREIFWVILSDRIRASCSSPLLPLSRGWLSILSICSLTTPGCVTVYRQPRAVQPSAARAEKNRYQKNSPGNHNVTLEEAWGAGHRVEDASPIARDPPSRNSFGIASPENFEGTSVPGIGVLSNPRYLADVDDLQRGGQTTSLTGRGASRELFS